MSRKSKKSKKHNNSVIRQELSASDQQKLAPKFQNIFDKQVLSEYENDNYRECIKQCDRILSQYPKNGESLAMKGLCFHCQGSAEGDKEDEDDRDSKEDDFIGDEEKRAQLRKEGLQLIAQGLKYNLKSSICWRVNGLAHKSDRNYESAIVCYKKACAYDKQNQRIYTDLASLQIQLKRFDEFSKTRQEIWFINQDKANCIAYVVSLYLNQEYDKCLSTLKTDLLAPENGHKFSPITDKIELNEIYLLQVQVTLKQSKPDSAASALLTLDDFLARKLIVDQLRALQLKVDILLKLDRFAEAKKAVLQLIEKNPENLSYHKQYLSIPIPNASQDDYAFYKNVLQKQYPKCNTLQRMLLQECTDLAEFETLMREYLTAKLSRSVMSLYNDVCSLYESKEKGAIIDRLIRALLKEENENSNCNCANGKMRQVWITYFYCSRLLSLHKFDLALAVINESIEAVPTCVELYVLKSRLYKYVGNRALAFQYLNYARELDKADRYLNTKCVRYALRAGLLSRADQIVSLFLKKTEGTSSLHSLQAMWYQLHKAEAHLLLQQYGPSIRQYQNVYAHFETFWKNQTDFHRYSYRKCAIHSYTQLLQWEYTLRNHPFFIRAAKNAMFLWIKIYKLQQNKAQTELQFGSSKYHEMDKKKHRQKDERGWKLIHCADPLTKLQEWLKHLLPLLSVLDKEEYLCVYIAYCKYLLYSDGDGESEKYTQIMENVKIMRQKYASHPYYIYHIFMFVFDDLKNESNDSLKQLKEEYSVEFLKSYYETHLTDFDKMWCVLQCCVDINDIRANMGYSTKDIMNQMIKIGCDPLKCVEVRNKLSNNVDRGNDLLQTFEKYVEMTYPLQVETSDKFN